MSKRATQLLGLVEKSGDPAGLAEYAAALESWVFELQAEASEDQLTGVMTRRLITRFLEVELARSSRTGVHTSVMLIDVDHFKHVNDAFGHHVGDAVLRDLGALLRQMTRATDGVGRLGGEEFVVVLGDSGERETEAFAWQLRSTVESMVCGDLKISVSISIGVVESMPGEDGEDVLKRADAAMYDAKHAGRNTVRRWRTR